MSNAFLSDDFLLDTPPARTLFHDHAAGMPIFDFHNHLSAADIAADRRFENLAQAWLSGDHYKWRAMRINGIDERRITGNATDEEKFGAWAATITQAVGNPLYIWTHLELRRYFGCTEALGPHTAQRIHDRCSALLRTPEFSARNLLRRMNIKVLCTTDDPSDDLRHHRAIRESGFDIAVAPTFRPDRLLRTADPAAYCAYLDRLGQSAGIDILDYAALLDALRARLRAFREAGCRIADHGLEPPVFEPASDASIRAAFDRLRGGNPPDAQQSRQLQTAIMLDLGRLYHEAGWVMQLHMGAMRNNSTRRFSAMGPDAGCDTMDDRPCAQALSRLLDALDVNGELPKTVLYNLNPRDTETLMAMAGCFADGEAAGKIQVGPAWWFADQRDGMARHLAALSALSLLGRFIGMTTDSRSLLSFPRHEYFRRILCRHIGRLVAAGEAPEDVDLLGQTVRGICFTNAEQYFGEAKYLPTEHLARRSPSVAATAEDGTPQPGNSKS
jgi:glucuronate isomerase